MSLSHADDYPIHQTPEPIAFAGTDRNFYDRYFFNGYAPDGSGFFALALGVTRISTLPTRISASFAKVASIASMQAANWAWNAWRCGWGRSQLKWSSRSIA